MTVFEAITILEGQDPAAQVMLNMTTPQMDQFKFVSINFIEEVGLPTETDEMKKIVLISHSEPGEETDLIHLN